jgi:hypothetical protein
MRKLGSIQRDVLRALERHGKWRQGGSWYWGTPSRTRRIMDSLVRVGCATVRDGVYHPVMDALVTR